jgi:uncharacterized damage-inducible protein DinB
LASSFYGIITLNRENSVLGGRSRWFFMTDKLEAIKIIAQIGLGRLERATKELKPEQLDWRPFPEANTLRWILTHEAYILHVAFPRILLGDIGYLPEGWPDDYQGNEGYSLEKILGDLEEGGAGLMEGLDGLTDESLGEEIEFAGIRTRKWAVMWMISEIIHHEGQVAAALGAWKRMKNERPGPFVVGN